MSARKENYTAVDLVGLNSNTELDCGKVLVRMVLEPCVTTLRTTITNLTLLFTNVTTTARDHDEGFTPH